jgi:tetratricopeptide (TPR) repeat protein
MRAQVRARRDSIKPTISVILIDWSVRESFHSLRFLNEQTFPRERTELIWVECYRHYPEPLRRAIAEPSHPAPLDQWIVLERSSDTYFHKHELYNAGILAAHGEICIICDSDAIFAKTFIYSVYLAMKSSPRRVVHVDEVRSESRKFYPFNNPTISDVLHTPGLINWSGTTTTGLTTKQDRLHELNYGACMCAFRRDLVAIGGADEHIDYLGYICGPHEMTFRLVNHGHREHWLQDEWIYHVWHPGQSGARSYGGPHDGRNFSTRTLALQHEKRVMPWVENPVLKLLREGTTQSSSELLERLGALERREWRDPDTVLTPVDPLELVESNVGGYNIVRDGQTFVALAQSEGAFSREKLAARAYQNAFITTSVEAAKLAISTGRSSQDHISVVQLPAQITMQHATAVATTPALAVKTTKSKAGTASTSVSQRRKHAARRLAERSETARLRLRSRLACDLGWSCYRAGWPTRALQAFDEALAADGHNLSARRGRATVYVAMGRVSDSLADFRVVVDRLASEPATRAKVLIERGWARYYLGESAEAARDFTRALQNSQLVKSPALANVYKGRCWALADARQWQEAMRDFKRYSQLRGRVLSRSSFFRLLTLRLSVFEGALRRLSRRVRTRLGGIRSGIWNRRVSAAARASR